MNERFLFTCGANGSKSVIGDRWLEDVPTKTRSNHFFVDEKNVDLVAPQKCIMA